MQSEINKITGLIVDSAMRVHSALGPGLLESAHEACLTHELRLSGVRVETQVAFSITYRGLPIEIGYRADPVVEHLAIVELKTVSKVLPVHEAQLLSYLRMSGLRVGLLINFNVAHRRDGITRLANTL